MADFQWTIGAEILWQVTRGTEYFFNTKVSEAHIREKRFPTVGLSWLASAIERNNVPLSNGRPKVFTAPQTRKMPPPSNGHNSHNGHSSAMVVFGTSTVGTSVSIAISLILIRMLYSMKNYWRKFWYG